MEDNNRNHEDNIEEIEVDSSDVNSDTEVNKQDVEEISSVQTTSPSSNNIRRNSSVRNNTISSINRKNRYGELPKKNNVRTPIKTNVGNVNSNSKVNSSLLSNIGTTVDGFKKFTNTLFNSKSEGNDAEKGSGIVKDIWNKLPLKIKLIIIGICAAAVFSFIFIVVLITPLMELGIIDVEGLGNSFGSVSSGTTSEGFTSVSDSTSYWWPVGGNSTNIGGVTFASEIPSGIRITSKFGMRKHPITGKMKLHSGVDIVGGSNIIAVTDGEVIYPSTNDKTNCASGTGLSDCGGGYGNYVMIRHGDGNITLYAHLYENSIKVRAGDIVKRGQVIAKMGSSGNSTGTHLHFEVRVNKTRVEPLNYININNPRP